ncbi:MAG: mannose-1-phosphate guanylyltransferase [Planctomycetota bacterium]|nr:mannose-1-phosphate guanylyltransferase [Planctomycetota bacterium]
MRSWPRSSARRTGELANLSRSPSTDHAYPTGAAPRSATGSPELGPAGARGLVGLVVIRTWCHRALRPLSCPMRYAMIMAGGAGTRLWPMSRKSAPKQLIKFIERSATGGDKGSASRPSGQRSLLELAAARLEGLVPPERRYICTAEAYRPAIRSDLPSFTDDRILGEPQGRDTINAVAFGAAVLSKRDPEAVFAVLTSDHIIEPDEVFKDRMNIAFKLVEADPRRLVTFAIKPTYPATGFGYVQRGMPIHLPGAGPTSGAALGNSGSSAQASSTDASGSASGPQAFLVERFVEKPDLARAQAYVQSGEFGWNSGMFVWQAHKFLECLHRFKPECHAGIMEIQDAWGTPRQDAVLNRVYPTLPKVSVDYGVMEPVAAAMKPGPDGKPVDSIAYVCTVPMDVRWLDVGSWPSYAQTLEPDSSGNRRAGAGPSMVVQGKNNLVVNARPNQTIAMLGVDELIVVQTADALLIMPRAKAEELKTLHGMLNEDLK